MPPPTRYVVVVECCVRPPTCLVMHTQLHADMKVWLDLSFLWIFFVVAQVCLFCRLTCGVVWLMCACRLDMCILNFPGWTLASSNVSALNIMWEGASLRCETDETSNSAWRCAWFCCGCRFVYFPPPHSWHPTPFSCPGVRCLW